MLAGECQTQPLLAHEIPIASQVLEHPYFQAGWSQPDQFWATVSHWASDDDPGAYNPCCSLWFWDTGVDLLFDIEVSLPHKCTGCYV